jgi:hypothetical protein
MRESRTYGFVRGVPGDWHPYRDRRKELFKLSDRVVNSRRGRSNQPKPLGERFCLSSRAAISDTGG